MNQEYKTPILLKIFNWLFFILFAAVLIVSVTWSGHVAGVIFIFWLLDALLIGLSLIVNKQYRENFVLKLARIKVRDEMEELDVCKAMRSSFLFMTVVLVILIGVSTFQTQTHPTDPEYKNSMSFLDPTITQPSWEEKERGLDEKQKAPIMNTNYAIPLGQTGMLMLLLSLQMGSYFIFVRRKES